MTSEPSPIDTALNAFAAAEANLERLERLLTDLQTLVPSGIVFGTDTKYDDLVFAYGRVLDALPPIDGWKPEELPLDLGAIAQMRFDAHEIGDVEAFVGVEDAIGAPERELARYRRLFNQKRREVIRRELVRAMTRIDEITQAFREAYPDNSNRDQKLDSPLLPELKQLVQQIDTLLGSSEKRPARWGDLRRHLHFGQVGDALDICTLDWPKIKASLTRSLYDRTEPIPVPSVDLGTLAASQPTGPVTTKLSWGSLSEEDFERLIYALIAYTRGYENPNWLMRTNAPDRGRDLAVTRIVNDELGGVIRSRVIIQCKHWLSRSVGIADVSVLIEQMHTWEPPRVDVLIIASSGRFSSDAVLRIEKHNNEDRALRIEMWPESHLERLLAERPSVVAEFGLR